MAPPFSDRAWDTFSITVDEMSLGFWMGREHEVGDAWARRFVLASPPAIVLPIAPAGIQSLVMAMCMMSSPSVAADCFDVVDRWVADGSLPSSPEAAAYLRGAKAFARGDTKDASKAWRPLIDSDLRDFVRADAFDRSDEPELAAEADGNLRSIRAFAGISEADPRDARRAAKQGDLAHARAIAKRVVDACGSEGADVPAVGDMRKILAR